MIGYLFFSLTVLGYVGLALLNMSKPVGNQQMGYAYALFLLGAAFAVSSLLLTITLLVKGSFIWIAQGTGSRIILALLAWLLMTLSVFFCAYFKWSWTVDTVYPPFIRWLATYNGQIWIPLPWLVACIVSLNPAWRSFLPTQLVINSFWVGLGLSALVSGGLVIGLVLTLAREIMIHRAANSKQEKELHQMYMDQIAANKPEDSIYNILRYAGINHDDDVQKAALAKIKAHSDWETQLLRLLQQESTYNEVYYFLGGNSVEHPDAFVQPLNQSIDWLSAFVGKRIKNVYNPGQREFDDYGISHLLMALDADQFAHMDTAFYSHITQLKLALETTPPSGAKDTRFNATDEVKAWLTKHKK